MQLSTQLSPAAPASWPVAAQPCLGYGAIVRQAYAGADLSSLSRDLVARVQGPVVDLGALLDLATLMMLQGGDLAAEGALMQRHAIAMQKSYVISHGSGLGLRILAFLTAGDFMANTPLDFLLHGSDAVLILHFVDCETDSLSNLPAHDVAFMAIGESPTTAAVLAHMHTLLHGFPTPICNNAPHIISTLSREAVARHLADAPGLCIPTTRSLPRADLVAALMTAPVAAPYILRPIGTHAGIGMALIASSADLAAWLRNHAATQAYAAPFIDYRGSNGLYAKQRIVLIKGKPYPSHMALSPHWMVHYLNADMSNHPTRRAAEAAWMADFHHDFAHRHATAFASLYDLIGLDYFGIDCAELPDGRLLVFEVDVAMIVHDMDPPQVFPYKHPAMRHLFAGFLSMLAECAKNSAG
ncbi:ATP-grasp domain-containing protein [Cypionkella sinensis]|uniref:RimK family alpha-L-glutamate ligase n=1 Tax=Cypionkella sinensis TaxID=1756043 RepID=A0ABV7J357_9RHOB